MEREGVSARPSTRDQRCREEEGASERPDRKGGWRRTGLLGTRGAPARNGALSRYWGFLCLLFPGLSRRPATRRARRPAPAAMIYGWARPGDLGRITNDGSITLQKK